jgi:hypothetical protein
MQKYLTFGVKRPTIFGASIPIAAVKVSDIEIIVGAKFGLRSILLTIALFIADIPCPTTKEEMTNIRSQPE